MKMPSVERNCIVLNVEMCDLLMETFSALNEGILALSARSGEQSEPVPILLQLRSGFAESPAWFLIQAAEFDPEPLTVANLRVRDVYASERLGKALLELMASEQWFDRNPQGAYSLTPTGHTVLTRIKETPRKLLNQLEQLPAGDVARLASLLGRIIKASKSSPTPPGTWCLTHSRNRAPAEDDPAVVQLYQYFSDFNAFRDDAHMAAWQAQDVGGYLWEAFALVCSGTANSAATVFDQLAHRGYSRSEYAVALAALTR